MDAEEHSHVVPTWQPYPRVHYFKSRYIDFIKRFSRVKKALPERFYEKAPLTLLDNLSEALSNNLHLMVVGKEDLSISRLTVYPTALNRFCYVPPTGTEKIHACVCYVKEQDLGEITLKSIDSILSYISSTLLDRMSCFCAVFIVCGTLTPLEEKEPFHRSILDLVPKTISTANIPVKILTGQKVEDDLPSLISNTFEKEIMNAFLEIFSFLQTFVRIDSSSQENEDILSSDNVVHAIHDFLRNGHHVIDSKVVEENVPIVELIVEKLCIRIMCSVVSPMASKHNIPEWVCHGLLDEISFEKELQKSILPHTRAHLEKVGDNALELIQLKAEGKYDEKTSTNKCFNFDFLVHMIKKDLGECVRSAEKKLTAMHQVTVIIRKMIFEIRGYLKQTIVEIDIVELGPRDLMIEDISDNLRQEIVRIKGVYGMGILYGQLEIHLWTGLDDEDNVNAKESIRNTLKRNRFPYPYTIKTVEAKPRAIARNFYQSGEKLLSPFPDNCNEIREGTLACYIKDSDGNKYGVTCAHVVDPHGRDEHNVYIRSQSCLFAHSSSHLTIHSNRTDMHFADFAAVKVLQENKDTISFHFKDELGHDKIGRIVNAQSSEIVGCNVYKYGASTGLTRGIVATNSYILSNEFPNYIIIVEPLPMMSENVSFDTYTSNQGDISSEFNESSPPLSQEDKRSKSMEQSPQHHNEDMISDSGILGLVQTIQCGIDKTADLDGFEQQNSVLNSLENCYAQVATNFGDNYIEISKGSPFCAGGHVVGLPRPEHQEGQGIRDSDLDGNRNPNEILSEALCDVSRIDTPTVATQGDSGAVVCRTNLLTNEIELISMITAGDFKLLEPLKSGSERKKCLSVSLKTILDTLQEYCGREFTLC